MTSRHRGHLHAASGNARSDRHASVEPAQAADLTSSNIDNAMVASPAKQWLHPQPNNDRRPRRGPARSPDLPTTNIEAINLSGAVGAGLPTPTALTTATDRRYLPRLPRSCPAPPLRDDRDACLLLRFLLGARLCRQLQHGGLLPGHQLCQQHDVATGEFQGVVMRMPLMFLDLAEAGDASIDRPASIDMKVVEVDVALERDLCARHKADGDVGLAGRSKTASDRFTEAGRDELVSHPGRARRHVLQTILAHTDSPCYSPTWP